MHPSDIPEILQPIYEQEMAARASYLAYGREIDAWAWVDMGLTRLRLTERLNYLESEIVRLKYRS